MIGAASFGILGHLAGEEELKAQAIAIEGSLVEKIAGVPEVIEGAVCRSCMGLSEGTPIHIVPNSHGASIGAAIAAALCV